MMSEELQQLEIKLAKVRLARETLELEEAQRRAMQKQVVSDSADAIMKATKNSTNFISRNVPIVKARWSLLFICAIQFLLLAILTENHIIVIEQNSPTAWLVILPSLGVAGIAVLLFIIKVFQLIFKKEGHS